MAEILIGGKKVLDLKVTELKDELGKRNLAKTGKKHVLIKRLMEAILVEQLQSKIDDSLSPPSPDEEKSKSGDSDYLGLNIEDAEEEESCVSGLKLSMSISDGSQLEDEEKSVDFPGTDSEQEPPKIVDASSTKEEDEKEEERQEDENDEEQYDDEMEIGTPEPEDEIEKDDENHETKRLESISSVHIEPSYPEEELIYEGDLENEGAPMEDTPANDDHHDELEVICPAPDFDAETTDKKASGQAKAPVEKPAASIKSASKHSSATSKPIKKITFSGKDGQKKSGNGDSSSSSSVWVSGLAAAVSASDLKTLFSSFGTVVSAKVVARASFKNQRYGYITLSSPQQAQKSVLELNKTELKGRKITVEIARSTPLVSSSKAAKPVDSSKKSSSSSRDKDTKKSSSNSSEKSSDRKSSSSQDTSKTSVETSPRSLGRRIISVERDGRRELVTRRGRRSEEGLARPRSRSRSPIRDRRHPPYSDGPRSRIVSRLSPPLRPHFRSEMMRREVERREIANIHNRLGDRIVDSRSLDARLAEQREKLLQNQERERAREREMIRRQMEMEHRRREEELAGQLSEMREREAHGRHLFERQRREAEAQARMVEERERMIRDKERQVKEAEMRERERLAALDKQRDKEFRERERRIREEMERELKEKERLLRQQEKELRDRERKIREEQERQVKLLEEERERQRRVDEQRRMREEQERKEQERRLREQEELKKLKEEQERAAKKAYSSQYRMDSLKRIPPAAGGSSSPESSSVFGRLGGRDGAGSGIRSGSVVKETAISPNLTYRRYEATSGRTQSSPYTPSQQARQKESTSSYGSVGYPQIPTRPSAGGTQQYGASKSSPSLPYGQQSYFNSNTSKEAKLTPEFLAVASKALHQIAAASSVSHPYGQTLMGHSGGSSLYQSARSGGSSLYQSARSLPGSHSAPVGYPHPQIPPSSVTGLNRPPSSRFPPPPDTMRYSRRPANPRPIKKGMY